jgi:hypothetical protein
MMLGGQESRCYQRPPTVRLVNHAGPQRHHHTPACPTTKAELVVLPLDQSNQQPRRTRPQACKAKAREEALDEATPMFRPTGRRPHFLRALMNLWVTIRAR